MRSPTVLRSLLAACACGAFLTACGDDGESSDGPCRSNDDCAANELCVDTVCEPAGCEGDACDDPDAADGSGDAGAVDAAGDADGSGDADGGGDAQSDADDAGDGGEDAGSGDATADAEPDIDYGPLQWEIVPSDGATGVPVTASIEVRFNQPMNALRFIPSNLRLTPLDGEPVDRDLAYDEESFTLVIGPTEDVPELEALTPHTLRLSELIRSASGETLGDAVFSTFSTGMYPGAEFHAELARAYAPTIYQEASSASRDVFTRVDFDDDFDMSNNEENARSGVPAAAYFDVVESRTHFFITYLYYYPTSSPRSGLSYEHDFVVAQLVVQKLTDEPLGRLRAFATLYHEAFNAWALDPSLYPTGLAVEEGDGGIAGRLSPEWLEEDRRVSLFINDGRHTVCLPNASTLAGNCAPGEGERAPFHDGVDGITLRSGLAPGRWSGEGDASIDYVLLSFVETFWALRDRTSDEDNLFGGDTIYTAPIEEGDARRPGNDRRYPAALLSDDVDGTFGELPFRLQATLDPQEAGVWYVDPAWFHGARYAFPESFALTYCFNPYLSIDRRTELEGCVAP